MSSLLIVYLVSMVLVGCFVLFMAYQQWKEGDDITLQDVLACIAITITPVLNTFAVISASVEWLSENPVVIKGKKQ